MEVQNKSIQVNNIPHKLDLEESDKLTQNEKIARVVARVSGAAATAIRYVGMLIENTKVLSLNLNVCCLNLVANAVGSTFWVLGSLLAPSVRAKSKQILTEWNVEDERADHMVDGGMEIVKAAVLSTGNVLRGLENASVVVDGSSARNNENK